MPRMIRATHAATVLDGWYRRGGQPPPEPEPPARRPRPRVRVERSKPAPAITPPRPLDRARSVLGPPPKVTKTTQHFVPDDGLVNLADLDLEGLG